jgi:hypothetical protein
MAYVRMMLAPTSSTLAYFKAWAQAIHNAIITVGWSQAGDTGQVDFDTLASISAGTQYYKMYYFNDSLHSSSPLYVKIGYWVGSSSQAGISIACATGTDGALTLTGNVSGTCNMSTGTLPAASTTPSVCIVSGAAGRLLIGLFLDYSSNTSGGYFGVERSIDGSTGAYTGDYFIFLCNTGSVDTSNGNVSQVISKPGQSWTISARQVRGAFAMPWSATTCIFNQRAYTSPMFPIIGQVGMASTLVQVVKYQDIGSTDGLQFKVTMYGSAILYQRWGTGANSSANALHNGDTYCRIGLRID